MKPPTKSMRRCEVSGKDELHRREWRASEWFCCHCSENQEGGDVTSKRDEGTRRPAGPSEEAADSKEGLPANVCKCEGGPVMKAGSVDNVCLECGALAPATGPRRVRISGTARPTDAYRKMKRASLSGSTGVAEAVASSISLMDSVDELKRIRDLLDAHDDALCDRQNGDVAACAFVDGVRLVLGVDGFERRRK